MQALALILSAFLSPAAGAESLDLGAKALADFRADEAVMLLEKAKSEGPYGYADHARLYEQLGIAYAYLERADDAREAFDMLLAIDPARAISYTLSPKVTFLFEQARGKALARTPPTVQVSWPSRLMTGEELPIDVEVVADPKAFLKRAALFYRQRGAPRWESTRFELAPAGTRHQINLPPVASDRAEALELHLTAFDDRGNAVLEWGSERRPRELVLSSEPPTPWYGKWWVWAVAGGVVAAGAAAAAVAVSNEPGPTVRGTFEVGP